MGSDDRAPQCPECHANSAPTELDSSAAGDRWLQCENCGHLWRSSGPRVDAFELIVRHRSVGAKLNRGHRPPHGVPRAARYAVKLALRYRLAASIDWELGQTEDISQSGVLFRTEHHGPLFRRHRRAQPGQPVELLLELPTSDPKSPVSRVGCLGEVVRANDPEAHGMLPTVAASVERYRLAAA